jgi:pimeloyl-ACP methyl ester carboxylesterase
MRDLGYSVSAPNLSLPSFERLSVEAAIEGLIDHFRASDRSNGVVLIASSFGAFLALHGIELLSSTERADISRLVLLAPALYPWHHEHGIISADVERVWREQGVFPIEQGATGEAVPVHYEFIKQLSKYSTDKIDLTRDPKLLRSMAIIHGARDQLVPIEQSRLLHSRHPTIDLRIIEDDHQLMSDPELLLDLIEELCSKL